MIGVRLQRDGLNPSMTYVFSRRNKRLQLTKLSAPCRTLCRFVVRSVVLSVSPSVALTVGLSAGLLVLSFLSFPLLSLLFLQNLSSHFLPFFLLYLFLFFFTIDFFIIDFCIMHFSRERRDFTFWLVRPVFLGISRSDVHLTLTSVR